MTAEDKKKEFDRAFRYSMKIISIFHKDKSDFEKVSLLARMMFLHGTENTLKGKRLFE